MVVGSTTTTYTYGKYNRLNSASNSGWSAIYTYNSNGDLIKLVNGSTWNYYYNYDNQLIGVSKGGAKQQNSTYYAFGNRVTNTISGATTVYLYQGLENIFQSASGTGTDYF